MNPSTASDRLKELCYEITGHSGDPNDSTEEFAIQVINYLEDIIACMPGSVYWKDTNGVYRGGNDELARLAGFKSRKEIRGKTDIDFAKAFHWDKEMLAGVIAVDQKVMQTGVARLNHGEEPFIDVNGNLIYQLTNKVPLPNPAKKVTGVVGISINISELKKMQKDLRLALEAAEASDRAKTDFIQNMSHDVKTPLAGIISMADRIGRQLEEPEALEDNYENVQMIKNSVKELIEFFMNCLEMGRIETEGSGT